MDTRHSGRDAGIHNVGRQPFAANEINLCFVGMGMPTYC
jgi:hypothetical protein